MIKQNLLDRGRLARLSYAIPVLFISTACLMHADATFTSGSISDGYGTSGNGSFSLGIQGPNISLGGFTGNGGGPLYLSIGRPSTDGQTVIFNPNQSLSFQGTVDGIPLLFTDNGTTYSNPNSPTTANKWVTVAINLSGPIVAAPAIPNFPATVQNVPFTMTGTVTVYASQGGAQILSIPISGSGLYTAYFGGGGGGNSGFANTAYQFQSPVVITSGGFTTSPNSGGFSTSVQIQGNGFSLGGSNANLNLLDALPSDSSSHSPSVNFILSQLVTDPPPVSTQPTSGSPLTLVYNGMTYTDFVVLSAYLNGGTITVPNTSTNAFSPGSYQGAVADIPFSMGGTVTVHSGSLTGPVTLSVPIAGFGTYSAGVEGLSCCSPNGAAIYTFTTSLFLGTDTQTKGAWTGQYGGDGYLIANGLSSLPSYASVSTSGNLTYTWAGQTTDPRALQNGAGSTTGIASAYTQYANNSVSFNVNLTDGNAHRVALYLLDWDTTIRSATITITDAATNTVLDTESFSSFSNGLWAVWNLRGNVIITVTPASGTTAAVSGIFFGDPGAPNFTMSAANAAIALGGSSTITTVNVLPTNGFNSAVALSTSGWPAGITGFLPTSPTTGSSLLYISIGGVAPGSYNLTVNGSGGGVTASTSFALVVPDSGSFTLSASSATATAGHSGTSTVTITPVNGFNSAVILATSNWPAGITGSFNPNGATTSSIGTITVGSGVAPGPYTLTVTGTGTSGSPTASTTIALTVTAATPLPSFTLSGTNVSIPAGSSGSATVTIVPLNGFNSAVTLQTIALPAGITATFATNPTTSSSVVTINVASTVAPGSQSFFVTGISGALTATTPIGLTVTAVAPSFALSGTNVSIPAGTSGSATVTIVPLNGFNSAVTLATATMPAGITATFATNPATSSSVVTINVASSVAPGPQFFNVTGTSGALTGSTTIGLTVTPGPTVGSSASYTGLDAAAEGAWNGKYGGDGFQIANRAISLPAYASVNIIGASTYTWAPQTSDPRALQSGQGSTTGFASEYYGNTFNINLNLTDGNTHQVALYLVDYDSTSRAEKIAVLDAATNTLLDQESFTAFHNGQWAVWNIKGNVIIQVTTQGGGNAVLSGIFFGAPPQPGFTLAATSAVDFTSLGAWISTITVAPTNGFNAGVTLSAVGWPTGIAGTFKPNPTSTSSVATITVDPSVAPGSYSLTVSGVSGALTATTTIALTVTGGGQVGFGIHAQPVTAVAGGSVIAGFNVFPVNGFGGVVTMSASGWPVGITVGSGSNIEALTINVQSSVAPGLYSLPVVGTSGTLTATTNVALTVTAAPPFGSGPSATYSGLDTTTQGAWTGKYGASGYMIANGPSSSSFNASGTVIGSSTYTWAGQTSDSRALVLPGTFNGIASAYTQYPGTAFTINVQTNGAVPVALYLLDWDSTSRSETITILDAATNTVLDTETFSGFHNGQYAKWNIQGNVIIKVTPNGSSSPVVSGIFFN